MKLLDYLEPNYVLDTYHSIADQPLSKRSVRKPTYTFFSYVEIVIRERMDSCMSGGSLPQL